MKNNVRTLDTLIDMGANPLTLFGIRLGNTIPPTPPSENRGGKRKGAGRKAKTLLSGGLSHVQATAITMQQVRLTAITMQQVDVVDSSLAMVESDSEWLKTIGITAPPSQDIIETIGNSTGEYFTPIVTAQRRSKVIIDGKQSNEIITFQRPAKLSELTKEHSQRVKKTREALLFLMNENCGIHSDIISAWVENLYHQGVIARIVNRIGRLQNRGRYLSDIYDQWEQSGEAAAGIVASAIAAVGIRMLAMGKNPLSGMIETQRTIEVKKWTKTEKQAKTECPLFGNITIDHQNIEWKEETTLETMPSKQYVLPFPDFAKESTLVINPLSHSDFYKRRGKKDSVSYIPRYHCTLGSRNLLTGRIDNMGLVHSLSYRVMSRVSRHVGMESQFTDKSTENPNDGEYDIVDRAMGVVNMSLLVSAYGYKGLYSFAKRARLTTREIRVIFSHCILGRTQQETADKIGVLRESVTISCENALKKIKTAKLNLTVG